MNEDERYLFDLQGFLVVEDALDARQLKALNDILDQRIEAEVAEEDNTHRFIDLLEWGQPYRDLVDNPRVVDYLGELIGDPLRLDHVYLDIIREGKGPIGTSLHGGATPMHPTHYYRHRNHTMRNGLFVVAYNLYDVNPGDGGFAAVPGSHKSNYAFPGHWEGVGREPGSAICDQGHRQGRDRHPVYRGHDPRHPALAGPGTAHDLLQVFPACRVLVQPVLRCRCLPGHDRTPEGHAGTAKCAHLPVS